MTRQFSRRSVLRGASVTGAALALPTSAAATPAPYELRTRFFHLAGSAGKLTTVAVDPTGRGHYEKPTLTALHLTPYDAYTPELNADVRATVTAGTLRLEGVRLPSPAPVEHAAHDLPIPLRPGHTIGQRFTVAADGFSQVGVLCANWSNPSSGVTLTLYDADLAPLASGTYRDIVDTTWLTLVVPTQPAGTYYLEASEPIETSGWWASSTPVDLGGPAMVDRQPVEGRTMTLQVGAFDLGDAVTWELRATGRRLTSSLSRGAPELTAVTPWKRDGYSISYDDDVLFSRFIDDTGRYLPAQQFKRQPTWSKTLQPQSWIHCTGTGPYDLRLTAPSITLTGTMTDDEMRLTIGPASLALDVLPHSDAVPLPYPVFTASAGARADQLSQFFYERAYSSEYANAGDWMDWEGRILNWSDTAAVDAVRRNLTDMVVGDDGYVYCWGSEPGWPFPDPAVYDTRHFTTNSVYVLGVYRHYSWTGDRSFLDRELPRVRRAIDFLLTTCHGSDGLLQIDAPDHNGRAGSIGTNYWDICSYGHLSAYDNAYFYGALDAAASLESLVGQEDRASSLRSLRSLVRRRYNETFWDSSVGRYIQCVDVDGLRHDYGCSYVNLEAAAFWLPTPAMAERIFDWLSHGRVQVSEQALFIDSFAETTTVSDTLGLQFVVDTEVSAVAGRFRTTDRDGDFTLTLRADGPGGRVLASGRFARWWDLGWAHLDVAAPAGRYYLEISSVAGSVGWCNGTSQPDGVVAFADGAAVSGSRALAVIGPERVGDADIYSRWVFAPRATTRRNNFWWVWEWGAMNVPWEQQLQDGGASLYVSGFDVLARAAYLGADDAWQRLCAILDRWAEPDHLCGGNPLYRGERPQGASGGQVGVDHPFPESGLVPASFLYAFIGVDARPDSLVVQPNLPSDLSFAGVRNLFWRGRRLDVRVTHNRVIIRGDGISIDRPYHPGDTISLSAR